MKKKKAVKLIIDGLERHLISEHNTWRKLFIFMAITKRTTYKEMNVSREEIIEHMVKLRMKTFKSRELDRDYPQGFTYWMKRENQYRRILDDEFSDFEDLITEYVGVWKDYATEFKMPLVDIRTEILSDSREYQKWLRGLRLDGKNIRGRTIGRTLS